VRHWQPYLQNMVYLTSRFQDAALQRTRIEEEQMPQATGYLQYGPSNPRLPRAGFWSILRCDPDWFRLYAPQTLAEMAPDWVLAVDRDRIFEGRRVDYSPHLALIRPPLQEPAWGPHISITRNERPNLHLDVWDLAVRIEDLQQRPSTNKKHLRQALETWDRWGVPTHLLPGTPVTFDFQISPQTNGNHWWFKVQCEALLDFREIFGLSQKLKTPLHLTYAVKV